MWTKVDTAQMEKYPLQSFCYWQQNTHTMYQKVFLIQNSTFHPHKILFTNFFKVTEVFQNIHYHDTISHILLIVTKHEWLQQLTISIFTSLKGH